MSIPCQADPHTGANTANDPAFMAFRCVGAGHRGAFSPRRQRVPVSIRHH
jgi:hypothetical protein